MSPRTGLVLLVAFGVAALGVLIWRGCAGDAPRREASVAEDAAPAPARAPAAADAPGGLPPDTRLPLRLLATVVRENPALSIATLEHVEGGGVQVLSEGDPVAGQSGVRVQRIERARILLDHDGVREQLRIDWNERAAPAPAATPTTPRAPARVAAPPAEAPPAADEAVAQGGELRGVYEDGTLIGVELGPVRPGGLYDRFGLREGDVLTSVNGIPLDGPDAVLELLREVAIAEQLEVDVERADGRLDVLSIPTAALDEALRQRD